MLNLDLSKLQEIAKSELEAKNNAKRLSENAKRYPIVYTGGNGKLTVKLLYNMKYNGIQRRILRHNTASSKVACMQLYGEDCPVCAAIKDVETIKGKDSGVYRKYSIKNNGICYAQIIDHDSTYFDKGGPKKGDVVLLMYPKTVYDQINKIIVDAGANLVQLVATNNSVPVVIERSQVGSGFPEYKVSIFPWGATPSFEDDTTPNEDGVILTGDMKYENMLSDLPDLGEDLIPRYPTEEVRNSVRALAETITQEYMSNATINPGEDPQPKPVDVNNGTSITSRATSENVTQTQSTVNTTSETTVSSTNAEGLPECFGNHSSEDKKCLICPHESDCYLKKN